MCVPNDASIAATLLPSVFFSSVVRTLIGAIAINDVVRQLAFVSEVLAQRAADDSQYRVVDRRPFDGLFDARAIVEP